jgi:16S rRNA (cytidine1402-2'-O)-methyltransferase
MSPRAREVLGEVDLILAEDTRRARALLSHLELPAAGRVRSLNEQNENRKVEEVVQMMQRGRSTAVISDAGTPVLSDPGFVLVRAARQVGLPVRSAPGPSSFSAALAASGQPPLPVTLCGFLPGRSGPRRRRISELAESLWTLVILLSPHRLGRELADLGEILGPDRDATLLAEISKRFERAEMATLGDLAVSAEVEAPRGEYIVVIGPPKEPQGRVGPADPGVVREAYDQAVSRGLGRREAMRDTARQFGLRRREVFDVLEDDDRD